MANTEVGTAYATLLPSAKGFAKNLKKDIAKEFADGKLDRQIEEALAGTTIKLPVRPEFDRRDLPDEVPVRPGREPTLPVRLDPLTKALQDDLRRQLSAITREVSARIDVGADTDGLRTDISDAIRGVEDALSAQVPTEPGERREYERKLRAQVAEVSSQVKAHIDAEVDVDVEKPLRSGKVDAAGETLGRSLASSVISSFTGGLSTIAGPTAFVGLAAAAAVAGPLIGASIAAGVLVGLGGGVIGLAVAALADDPLFQRAVSGLGGAVKSTLARAAGPLLGTEDKPGPLLLAMETLTDLVVSLEPQLTEMFAAIGPYIPTLAAGIADFVRAVMPGLVDAVKASGPVLEALAVNMKPLGESLGRFLTVMSTLAPAAIDALSVLTSVITHLMDTTALLVALMAAAFSGIYGWYESLKDRTADVWHSVTSIFTTGGVSVKQRVEALIGALLRLWSRLTGQVSSATSTAVASVVRLFAGLPGRIRSAVGNLGGLLYQAGKNVVQGLINGMKAMFGPLTNVASSMAGIIRDHLPFSPAKEGPLSGRGNPFFSGQSIVKLLASGVTSTLGTAEAAAADLAGTFALGGSPLAAGPISGLGLSASPAPAPAPVVVGFGGDAPDSFMRWMRENVRIYYGGSPQAALGS